nr:hypothetical protein [Tanacetum cinerariifolium]
FCVARTKDVISSALKLNGGEGSCIQDLSIVDVFLGKDCEPSFSKSINGSSYIKDMHWSPHVEDQYVVLTSAGKLYRGAGQKDLSSLLDDVDAVNWIAGLLNKVCAAFVISSANCIIFTLGVNMLCGFYQVGSPGLHYVRVLLFKCGWAGGESCSSTHYCQRWQNNKCK